MTLGNSVTKDERRNIVNKKIRGHIDQIMAEFSEKSGKSGWCEKSINTIDGISAIQNIFPDARYICLYRNCLDQVHSALETFKIDPTGTAYGFNGFLNRAPGDPTNALIDYWYAKSSAIQKFERENPEKCVRIRYEDVVLDSNNTLKKMFSFLKSDWNESMLDSIFTSPRVVGPGDYKIVRTDKIRSDSVGCGKELEVKNISADRLEKMNRLLVDLGYNSVH